MCIRDSPPEAARTFHGVDFVEITDQPLEGVESSKPAVPNLFEPEIHPEGYYIS